ncbi:uncharacterized protein LOC143289634 [Babylonia areolata]|uniref:uncharacterized protein LOC143289634 n=1 Tax=Babylonia areolata TaxID=304850 RepID=UPI003FD40C3D
MSGRDEGGKVKGKSRSRTRVQLPSIIQGEMQHISDIKFDETCGQLKVFVKYVNRDAAPFSGQVKMNKVYTLKIRGPIPCLNHHHHEEAQTASYGYLCPASNQSPAINQPGYAQRLSTIIPPFITTDTTTLYPSTTFQNTTTIQLSTTLQVSPYSASH